MSKPTLQECIAALDYTQDYRGGIRRDIRNRIIEYLRGIEELRVHDSDWINRDWSAVPAVLLEDA